MQIERNVPMPARRSKYPWDEMEVGDSFFADAEASSLRSCARYQAEKTTKKFVVRKEADGTRVWRVS